MSHGCSKNASSMRHLFFEYSIANLSISIIIFYIDRKNMAKKKADTDKQNAFLADITKTTGGATLDTAGNVPYFIDTGNLALNYMCSGKFVGGGIPGGRITEVFGPPATSKSLLGYCCLGNCQRMGGVAVLLDCERAGSADFATSAGHVDPSRLITYEPVSIEQTESKIIAATKAIRKHYGLDTPILFVWDSIGVTPCEREWAEIDLPENPSAAQLKAVGLERPGERARASGNLLRKINPFLNEQNASLYVINQVRNKIGVLYGSPETNAGGGKALEYYASCRLRTSAMKKIENKTGLPLGVNLRFENKKSRSFVPGMKTEGVQLFFKNGINPFGGLLSVMIAAERIIGSRGNYTVAEPWADGKKITFKASSERNDMPLQPFLDAPKLIDLNTEEEVKEYLALYEGAMSVSAGDSIVEKTIDSEGDETPSFIEELTE